MDFQAKEKMLKAGNNYLLVEVGKAKKILFAYALSTKEAVGVVRKLV